MEITHDNLPKAVSELINKVDRLELLLLEKTAPSQLNEDCWFDLENLCNYLPDKPTKPTVYNWIHNRSIPSHKGQKKLRFLKSEIDAWLNQGTKRTIAEIKNDVGNFLSRK